MTAPQEIEGALVVWADAPEAVARRLAALDTLAGYQLVPRPAGTIVDTYLDTRDRDLAARRIAFRVRRVDRHTVLTLKAGGRRATLATERLEIEAPWSPSALPAAARELRRRGVPLGEPPADLAGRDPVAATAALGLQTTQVRETRRLPRDVTPGRGPGGRLAELAIDLVAYRLPGQPVVRLVEVEVEAKEHGDLAVVERVLGALRAAFPDELRPWPHGKLPTGKAIEELLADGRLDGLLDPGGTLRAAAWPWIERRLAADDLPAL